MKRFLGILSLIIVVGTEVLTPITYANDLVLNEEVYQSVDSNISDIPENDNVAGDQNNVNNDTNFSDNTDEDTGEQGSLSHVGEENDGTVEPTETDEKDNQEQTETGKSDTQEQTETNSVTATEDEQGTDTVQCEDAILHGIYDEECVFQEKCEEGYVLEENECVLSEDIGSDLGEYEETVEENKEGESSSAVVVEDTDFSFIDSLSDIAKEIIGGLRYFFTRDSDSFIKYSTSGDEGIIVLIDPENGDSMTIMDKNLGAESTSEEDEKSYGNYYQWGSNNGISGDKIADFIENEEVNSTGDWNGDDEEIQGPCPTGYHIPTQNEWTSLVNVWRKIHTQDVRENVDDEGTSTVIRKTRSTKGSILLTSLEKCNEGDIEVEGKCIAENEISGLESLFMSDLKLPKAGSYSANGEYRDGVGSYWTVTPSENVTTQSEIFSIDKYFGKGIYDDEKDRTSWHNVRCFLDTKVKEKVVENNLNKEEIVGELEHDGVVVKVIAPVGSFYEGTEPRIKVITEDDGLDDVKDEIADSQDNVSKESKMVAFDISFMYKVGTGEIEVQPVEGKTVKVLFDYKLNDDFLDAETDENQEVKVFHLEENKETTEEDIDSEQGEIVEEVKTTVVDVTNEEESVGTGLIVADGESFSIYVLTLVESNNSDIITLDGNGGVLDDDTNITNLECDDQTNICTGDISSLDENIVFPNATKQHAVFLGWIGSGTDTGLDSLTKNPVLSTGIVAGHTYKAKYTCDYGYVDIDNVCVLLADAPSTGLVYDSESQTITVWGIVGGVKKRYTIQDRNVGATVTGAASTVPEGSIGKLFQWGNNYWIYRNDTNFSDTNVRVDVGIPVPSSYSGALYNVNKDDNSPYSTTTTGYYNLWGDYSAINDWNARRGPCDDGYHVPSRDEVQALVGVWNIAKKNNSSNISVDLMLPVYGTYQISGKNLSKFKTDQSKFWTTTMATNYKAYDFHFKANGTYNADTDINITQKLLNIRCFQNYANCSEDQHKNGLNCDDNVVEISCGDVENGIWTGTKEWNGNSYDVLCNESDIVCDEGAHRVGNQCIIGYLLDFDVDGGSDVESQVIPEGLTGTIPSEDPEKDGYTFEGWYWIGLDTPFNFAGTVITGDTTVYAKWSLTNYTITYNLDGGTGENNPTSYTKETGTFTLNNPTKSGYGFEGWSGTDLPECSAVNSLTCSRNVTIQQGSTGNRIYDAIWGEIKYDLNFDTLGGSEILSQRILHGRTGSIPSEVPEKDGYTFVGWYWTGLEIPFNFTETAITGDTTVYAKWSLTNYTITYNLDGGTGENNPTSYTKETGTFTLNNPRKLNYDFIGWSGTDLSGCSVEDKTTCDIGVVIEQGSTGNRVYDAIYDCAYGKKLDGTCNIVRGEDGLIDYNNWEYNELEVDLSITEPRKIVIMDRNLGATISGTGENAFGFYYQWGNNYGFRNVIGKNSTEQVDANAYGPSHYYVSDTFIIQESSSGWDAPSNYNLWGGTGDTLSKRGNGDDEARQGPCPTGYHVPSIREWRLLNTYADNWGKSEKATDACIDFNDYRECVLSKILKLPRAGNINGNDGILQVVGDTYGKPIGRYWSSTRNNDAYAHRYKINEDWNMFQGANDNGYHNANGMSVRCFKNVSSKPLVYELSGGVQASNQTSTVVWWNEGNIKKLTIPTKTGFVFEGWYLTPGYEEGTRVTTNEITDYSDNESVTLYANWKVPEYKTITYNANGGSFVGGLSSTGIVFKEEIESGNYVALTNVQFPNRVGYMFDGWYLAGGETEWTGYVDNSTEEQTVYAKWLTFNDLTVTMSGITFTLMDRNLGATDYATGYTYGSDNEQNNQSRVGKYYQWGNNYGLSGSKNTNLGNSNFMSDTNDFGPGNYFSRAGYVFTSWKWGNTHKNLWGGLYLSSGDETRQGPCPVNYHVPTKNEWDKVLNLFNVWKQTEEGSSYCESFENSGDMYCFSARLGLPFAGNLDGNTLKGKGTSVSYRSSNQKNPNNDPYKLQLSDMQTNTQSNGYGHPVRCFKNTERKALNFESKGGEITNAPTETVRWWETTTALPTPTRDNSIFSGWYTTPGYVEGTKVTENYIGTEANSVTLYAKWECDEGYEEVDNICLRIGYNVTYNSTVNGGTTDVQIERVESGEHPTLSAYTGYKEGWIFVGWNTNSGATTSLDSNDITVTGPITLYAVYKQEAVTPKLHVHLNGNTSFSNTTTSHTEDALFDICTIPEVYNLETQDENCSISGRIFNITANGTKTPLGWSLSANTGSEIIYTPGEHIILTGSKSNPEVHLYAQSLLTGSSYSVTFSGNGAKLGANDDDEIQLTCTGSNSYNGEDETKSIECSIITPEITRTGYTIQGYTGVQNYEVIDSELLKGGSDLTLSSANNGDVYYVNSYKPVTITFDRNGNTAQIKSGLTNETTANIEETCNIWNRGNSCSITTPTIIPATGKTVKGYSTSGASFENEIAHQTQISVSTGKTYYAWSEYIPQTFTGFYTVGVGVNDIDITSGSCTTEAKYNEESIVNSCKILLPEITAIQGYINPKWYNGDNEVVLDNEGKVEIDSNVTFTAKAIKDRFEITISSNNEDYGRVTSGSLIAEQGVAISTSGNELTIGDVEILAIATGNSAQYSYQFSGWNSTCGNELIGNCTIEAEFIRTINKYTITFYDEDGERVLDTQTVNYGTNAIYGGITPSKEGTQQYTYAFTGWYTAKEGGTEDNLSNVVANRNVYARYSSTVNKYNITFVDEDGTVLKASTVYDYGTPAVDIVKPADPTKESSTQYTYTFAGWTPELTGVTQDAVYTATYNNIVRQYTIIFNNDDGQEIERNTLNYGSGIVAPTATKAATAQYTYTFAGWDPALPEGATVSGDAVYIATYTATTNTYEIIWKNEDGTVLETDAAVEYGVTPLYNGATPQKSGDAQYTYTFAGWTPELTGVTENAVYTAKYTETLNKYTVAFVDDDGREILSKEYNYGTESGDIELPADPTKESTAQYTYHFAGWTPELVEVTENAVYTAVYNSEVNQYTIIFNDEDGTELGSGTYNYGTESGAIVPPEEEPTKERTAQYTFTFAGWTPELTGVTQDAVYTATYSSTVNQYRIIFNDEDGTELGSGVYDYGTESGAINQPETPTKNPTSEYTFTFAGWDPELTGVTEAAVYTATYTETLNRYVVTYDKGTNKGTAETETSNVDYGTLQLTGAGAEQAEREGYQFIGWATGADQTGVVDSYLIDSDKTFYAVYKKIGSRKDITIHLNGNTGFVYNDVTYNDDQSFSGCKFKDIYNLEPESTECNFTITLPAIGAPEATPHVLGWTTGATYPSDGVELYTVPGQLSLTGTLNSELHLYAQTKSDEKTYTITYATDNRVNLIGITSDSCTIPSSYNGVAQSYVCPDEAAITLPSLTAKQGYNTPVWTDGETNRMPGAKISLGVNLFLTGTASPNETTPYIVKHYFQLLSGDNTLSNRYQLSGTDIGLSGTTEQVLVLSSLAKDESLIPGYSYSRARVNGEDVAVIDLTDISIFDETGAIDPDGNLIIKLFYTRKPYYYTENSVEHASVQRSPLSDSYYYGQTILFTGVADEGYSFSGFTINDEAYNTSVLNYEVGTSNIEVTPEIREHTYTIHFNGNGATEGSVSDVTGYYSDTIQLPSNTVEGNKFEKLGYHFMGWSKAGESTILKEITKGTPDDNGEITLYAQWEENATGSYRVEYYTEPVEGGTEENYQLYSSGTYSADTYSVVTGARIEITGFDIPDEKTGIVLSNNSLVIKYYYPRTSYTFTFNAGAGATFSDGSTSTGIAFKYGRQVIFPSELSLIKTGFTFASWNPVLGVMPADNSSSIAQWNENHYTIKFNANGGVGTMEDVSSVAYTENKLLSTNTFTRNGYTFLGWSKNQGATVSTYNDGTTVNRLTNVDNGEVILYAVWSKDTYTITYDLAGGALDDGVSNKESYTVTDSDFTLNNPKKDGYTFKGWQELSSEEIIETVTIAQGSTGSKYFVARWTPIMYSISYDLDGGSLKPGDSNPLEYSIESGSIEIKNPVKNGYTFRGWTGTNLEELSGALVIQAGSTGNRSYIAEWTINQYKASFVDENGDSLYENYFDYNTIPQYAGSEPSKPADQQYTYTFGGWNPIPSAITEDSVYTATYDSTLRQYTITFKNDDGTELKKETLNYGSGIVPPTASKAATPQYTYHFAGWNPELPEGATVSNDAVYTATYTETTNTYEIIWKNEDGTVLETDSAVAYGTTPVYNGTTPQKTGDAQYSYAFNIWSPAVSQVTGNATYTATYTQTVNKYTAIFENYDGVELYELENIPYGTVPTYGGSTPVKPQDERYIYTFNNIWLPSLVGITGDTTYTAQYDKVDRLYTITFKDGEAESSNTYIYQTATGDLQIPNRSKTGHTLVWQPDLSPVVQDQVYTASYVRNSYKVLTLAETGVDHIDGSGTYLYEAEVTFTGYAKSGYHFDDGDVVLTHTFNVPAYDSIVKMNANPNIYKVRYLKNGGVGTPMADQTFTYDETGALAVNTFVKTGSYFKGWLDVDNNMYSDGQEVINLTGEANGIVLLIAQWSDTAKHTLKVIDTDGSVLQTKLYSSGDIISLDTPTKKGYLFVEWTNYPENGLMPDRDVEIGVVWKVNPDDQGQSSGQSGGGGGRVVPREDKVIIPEEEEHGAAQESGSQEVVQPKTTDKDNDENLTLYQWAYKYGITTKLEDESNPDGVLLRGHMAKIIVNYVVNVLGRKEPKVIPDRCSFIDNEIDWKSEEIKQYSKRACALGLMGINVESFNPNAVVTRAQFGTVLSRVLWGDTYNLTGASYYDLHLKALKRKGIMTKIEHPINVVEIRKWAWLMLRRAYEDYEIKD